MKKLIGILIVTLALGASSARAQKSGTQNVVVTNSSANPVPAVIQGITNVGGTVGVTGLVDVNIMNIPLVTLQGTPTVYLSPGSSIGINGLVQVTNTPLNPLYVAGTSHAASFVVMGHTTMPAGQASLSVEQNIPAGKMFVIEAVSVRAFLPPGQSLQLATVKTVSFAGQIDGVPFGVVGEFDLPITGRGTHPQLGSDIFVASQAVRLYTRGTVGLFFLRNNSAEQVFGISYRIFGYLVDVP